MGAAHRWQNSSAKMVLPAPFGPATIQQVGITWSPKGCIVGAQVTPAEDAGREGRELSSSNLGSPAVTFGAFPYNIF